MPPKKIPKEFSLFQNFPNPFNPETWIPYQLAFSASVEIGIYDVNGKLVRKIEMGKKDAGYYKTKEKAAYWDGRDNLGQPVASLPVTKADRRNLFLSSESGRLYKNEKNGCCEVGK